jgi:diguanylate cyclase (GGDEF)-like protein
MFKRFLPDEPKQRLRLKRHFAALAASFIYTIIGFYLFVKGYFRPDAHMLFIGLGVYWAGLLGFTFIIRSGINLKFKDPSITLLQMYWSVPFMLLAVYTLNDLRSIMLLAFFALLSFGTFRLTSKQFFAITAITIFGYIVVLMMLYINQPLRLQIDREILHFIGFSLTSVLLVYTGSTASQLRERNHQQNMKLTRALAENKKLATTDDLTGLTTRRRFMEILGKQKAWSERDGSDFVIVFADLDHFKYINDSFGHHTGDVVLQTFAEILRKSIREIDYAARFGGEEFVILLINTDIEQSITIAERVRKSLEQYNFSDLAPALNVTVSMGLANFKQFNSIQETLMCADNRMYKAKEAGRNMLIYEN